MPNAQLKILCDTNVWLDNFIADRDHSQAVKEMLALCPATDALILFPMHALNDVFYQVARDAKDWVRKSMGSLPEAYAHAANDHAWDCLESMLEVGTPVGADGSDVWLACHLRDLHPDFEDNMVLAAAERVHADFLVTSDKQLIKKATVAALTPTDMLKVLRMR